MTKFTDVRDAAFNHADAGINAIETIKKAGVTDPETRASFILGDMGRTFVTKMSLVGGENVRLDAIATAYEKALKAIAKAGEKSTSTKEKRTATEEKAYGAARAKWSRYAKKAGVKNTGHGSGNSNAGKGAASKTNKPKSELALVVPTCATVPEMADAFAFHALACADIARKNRETIGKDGTALNDALAAFALAIKSARAL